MGYSKQDHIEVLNLSTRAYNSLMKVNVNSVSDLMEFPLDEIPKIRNLGNKTLKEILDIVESLKNQELSNDYEGKIFLHEDGNFYRDVEISSLAMGKKAIRSLNSVGYFNLSEVLNLKKADIKCIPGISNATINDVIKFIYLLDLKKYESKIKEESINSKKITKMLFDLLSPKMHVDFKDFISNIEDNFYYLNDLEYDVDELNIELYKVEVISKILNNEYIKSEYQNHIINILKREKMGCNIDEIIINTPNYLNHHKFVISCINELQRKEVILIPIEGIYLFAFDSFFDCLDTVLESRESEVFLSRINGMTLEEVGKIHGITRERVRQIEKKASNKIKNRGTYYKEDYYSYLFIEYEISRLEFNYILKDERIYNYLYAMYSKDRKTGNSIHEAINDTNIPEKLRRNINKLIYKDCIKLGEEYIDNNRPSLTNYILKHFAQDEIHVDEFIELFETVLSDIEKKDDDRLTITSRGYINWLCDLDTVLWKYGKKLRYYNINNYDFKQLIDTLNIEQYENVEYSTKKFLNTYPEIMEMYDIRDEYELHNLLKKIYKKKKNDDNLTAIEAEKLSKIDFTRMPNIWFGEVDRDKQVADLLKVLSPISPVDFCKEYEEKYGVLSQTVQANYIKCIELCLKNGEYIIDLPVLEKEIVSEFKDVLTQDYYSIDQINNIFIKMFPQIDISLLGSFLYKSAGFKVFSSYVISDKYSTANEYFEYIILKDDIFDLSLVDAHLKRQTLFTGKIYELKSNYKIIEFLPEKYIKYERLEKYGLTIDRINYFTNSVFSYIGENKYFTIQSLIEDGFINEMDEYGFDYWFSASLITECKERVSYLRVGANKLFMMGKVKVSFDDFIETLVCDKFEGSVDKYDLIYLLENTYGFKANVSRILEATKNTELHYDAISEKIYENYDRYYEEI